MYSGQIQGIGPRYCPSVEDKVVRFAEKPAHTIFLEPDGWDSEEIYVNGLSTSLPEQVQLQILAGIRGLGRARMLRPGYAVEYDFVFPEQLRLSLEALDASRALPGRADQRDLRLRGGGRPGPVRRRERRPDGAGGGPLRPGAQRGLHRRS